MGLLHILCKKNLQVELLRKKELLLFKICIQRLQKETKLRWKKLEKF